MCDYSLHNVATRPAKVGDKLVTGQFANCLTRCFSAIGEPHIAVCLSPGTEIAFNNDAKFEGGLGYIRTWSCETKNGARVARFRQLNTDQVHVHHDALEFPDGQIVLLTRLVEGQQRRFCSCLPCRRNRRRNSTAIRSHLTSLSNMEPSSGPR
jgi:hypothetical protein